MAGLEGNATEPPPDWWRGQTPVDSRHSRADAVVISGAVSSFDPQEVPLGAQLLRRARFERARCSGLTISLDELRLQSFWSEFQDCRFSQRGRRVHDEGAEPQGSFGNRPSRYTACTFTGVRFRLRAGFSPGQARFEACVFEDCRFEEHFSPDADYIRCQFVGPVRTAVFFGVSPTTGRRNQIEENDFSAADLGEGVAWRAEFPIDRQRWPAGYRARPSAR